MAARLKQCGLELHPEKTKVVYCKDTNRRETHLNEKFDFLGFTFRPRKADGRKGIFCSFGPASRRRRRRKSGTKFEDGSCIAVRGSPSKSLPGRSIPNFGGGSTTMGVLRL